LPCRWTISICPGSSRNSSLEPMLITTFWSCAGMVRSLLWLLYLCFECEHSSFNFARTAGTHDLHLAMTTLHSLQHLRKATTFAATSPVPPGSKASPKVSPKTAAKPIMEVLVPRYDKALREGRGDRLPRDQWMSVTGTRHCVCLHLVRSNRFIRVL